MIIAVSGGRNTPALPTQLGMAQKLFKLWLVRGYQLQQQSRQPIRSTLIIPEMKIVELRPESTINTGPFRTPTGLHHPESL